MFYMEYKEALEYLDSLPKFSISGADAYKPGLHNSLELARKFDNPHKKFKSIHIGGTNGKGSTSHMLASILQEEGYKVGLYTSPHLIDFRERIKINGEMIPENEISDFISEWEVREEEIFPSFFEFLSTMAFSWFAKEKVDIAVVEVGLGGRLDSTNIITPLLSVITNISRDHEQFLGDTLSKIATEKAGIIKKGIPVVVGETDSNTAPVFIEKAQENGSEIYFADKQLEDLKLYKKDSGWEVDYTESKINVPLAGDYQERNIKTVLSAIERLRNVGVKVSDSSIRKGLEKVEGNTGLLGRWTQISKSPIIIADTGHNLAGMVYNSLQLKHLLEEHKGANLRIVVGFMADKAIDEIISLLPNNAKYYVADAGIPRSLPAKELQQKFSEREFDVTAFSNPLEAYEMAKKEASEKDIIFIGGSNAIVGKILPNL